MRTGVLVLSMFAGLFWMVNAVSAAPTVIDLSQAVIVGTQDALPPKAVLMLQEEVERRSGITLEFADTAPNNARPVILIGTNASLAANLAQRPHELTIPETADGYAIWVDKVAGRRRVVLVGSDSRGALFAVGRLIRGLHLADGVIRLDASFKASCSPESSIRGHQIGYRHTANTYDAWDVATYEQYIRDLILFGTNSVELIQEGGRGYRDGPVLQQDQWDMNVQLTRMIKDYGIDIWFWEPLKIDVTDPVQAKAAMQRRADFYADCAHIDHVMVPGGDPGHTPPELLMPWLKRQAVVLHNRFPDAGLWVSPQGFTHAQQRYFFNYLQTEQPDWLAGIVYGPGVSLSLEETRRQTPPQYRIRRYPDITHNVRCQYPVPGLDGIIAQTLGREGINPRPSGTSHLHNLLDEFADGFVSYSDGAHDDLNKMVWSEFGCNSRTNLDEMLVDYGRVFFGAEHASDVARGLKMLERNLKGAVRDNAGIDETLKVWQRIEKNSGGQLDDNWRFQMYLFRALFDAYIRGRHLAELDYEANAMAALATAAETGVSQALSAARAALAEADRTRVLLDQRILLEEMGARLLRLIGFQLSVDEPYLARNPERGALLDKLDRPLNDRLWLEAEMQKIEAMGDQAAQLKKIDRILNWDDPGPGGFYDDLGNPARQPHLVRDSTYLEDPGYIHSPHDAHLRSMDNGTRKVPALKWSWMYYAQGGGSMPIKMRYEELAPEAKYRLRVTYHGRFAAVMTLKADGEHEIHGALPMPQPVRPVEFDIPHSLTRDGTLDLRWDLVDRRGCQVAEVWLMRR